MAIVLSFGTLAQITITYDDLLDVGDSVSLAGVDSIPPGTNPGFPGPNQHWDFSYLLKDTVYTLGFIDPANTPYAASFPSSNIAAEGLIDGFGAEGFAYATKNLSVFQIDGFAGSYDIFEDVAVPFDPPEIMFDFPMNYLDSMQQTSTLIITVESPEPPADSIRLKLVTTVTTKIDAWGEITTPVWVGDVLRITDYRYTVDTAWVRLFGFWFYAESGENISQTYKFMANDLGYPVMQFNLDETGTEYTMTNYLLDVDTRISESERIHDVDFKVYPIPASDILFLSIADDNFEGEFLVYDMMGKLMTTESITSASGIRNYDVSSYPSGVYQAVLKGDNKLSVKKFIVK